MRAGVEQDCAAAITAVIESSAPAAALQLARIELLVRPEVLVLAERTIHGAWDPLLRRIELFGCDTRRDVELVATFTHELLHAYGARPTRELGEAGIHTLAERLVAAVDAATVARCASALRDMAAASSAAPVTRGGSGRAKTLASPAALGPRRPYPDVVPPGRRKGNCVTGGNRP